MSVTSGPVLHDSTTSHVTEGDTVTQFAEFLPDDAGRLPCASCGMVANVDPDFHADRYDHAPSVRVDGVVWRWYSSRNAFGVVS